MMEILYTMIKKIWNTPALTTYGAVEILTQMDAETVAKAGNFLFPNQGYGLLASLEI